MPATASNLDTPVLLVAMPQVLDPFFHKSVVLLIHHEEEGSLGFIVNRPTGIKVSEILHGMEVEWRGRDNAVAYFAGPVQPELGTVLFAASPAGTAATAGAAAGSEGSEGVKGSAGSAGSEGVKGSAGPAGPGAADSSAFAERLAAAESSASTAGSEGPPGPAATPDAAGEPFASESASQVAAGISLTQHVGDLSRLAEKPPERFRLFLGYAGWGSGQLIAEILRNDWLTAPVRADLIFAPDPEGVWEAALQSVGVDPAALPSWTAGPGNRLRSSASIDNRR